MLEYVVRYVQTLYEVPAASHSLGSDQVVLGSHGRGAAIWGSRGPGGRGKLLRHVAAVVAVHPHLLQGWVPEQLHKGKTNVLSLFFHPTRGRLGLQ